MQNNSPPEKIEEEPFREDSISSVLTIDQVLVGTQMAIIRKSEEIKQDNAANQ